MDEYYLIDLLAQQYIIDEMQANQVKDKMLEENKSAVDCLEELEFASEEQVLQILAVEYSMETFDLDGYVIPEEVIQTVPPDIAKRYRIVPVMKTESGVTVGITDPTKFMEVMDSLHYLLNMEIDAMVVKKGRSETGTGHLLWVY